MTTTDADRAKAAEVRPKVRVAVLQALVRHHPDSGALAHVVADEVMPVVAAAIAEARAPYDRLTADLRALAEEWERRNYDSGDPYTVGIMVGKDLASARLRAVVEEQR